MNLLYILLFGMAGVVMRYGIGAFVTLYFNPQLPFATFGINIVGSFLIGVVYAVAVERPAMTHELRLGLMVGLLGGFTTFSSYCLETLRLIEESEYFYATLYLTLSPLFGLGATFIGAFMVRKLMGGLPG
jgi:CrcB protein